jgi:hypothetical protein
VARDIFISNSSWPAILILLFTKLVGAAFYSQVNEIFVHRTVEARDRFQEMHKGRAALQTRGRRLRAFGRNSLPTPLRY